MCRRSNPSVDAEPFALGDMDAEEKPDDEIVEGEAVVGFLPKICASIPGISEQVPTSGWMLDNESDPHCQYNREVYPSAGSSGNFKFMPGPFRY